MIRNDKKVALRKHLERLTLSDVRDGSGGRGAVSCHGLARFPVGTEKAACCVVPAPAFEARRSIEETFCLPSELRASCTQACYLSGHDQSARSRPQSPSCIPRSHLPEHRWFQDSARHRQCRSASSVNVLHLSRVSPRFPTICDAPVQFFPSGATSGDALEPGVN